MMCHPVTPFSKLLRVKVNNMMTDFVSVNMPDANPAAVYMTEVGEQSVAAKERVASDQRESPTAILSSTVVPSFSRMALKEATTSSSLSLNKKKGKKEEDVAGGGRRRRR